MSADKWFSTAHNRYQGYTVPAECDHPLCDTQVNHGMDFRCTEHSETYVAHDRTIQTHYFSGCEHTYCDVHRHVNGESHYHHTPKPNLTSISL